MTVPDVGTMVALSFIATIDVTGRFRRASDVCAFLWLTPRRYRSGETDYSGRILKCGDASMRTLLFEACGEQTVRRTVSRSTFSCLIRQVRRFSPLKAWAARLAARESFTKVAVATARKLAVILHCIWRDGTEFAWTKETRA